MQGILSSDTGASVTSRSDRKKTDKAIGDNSNGKSRKQVSVIEKSVQNGVPAASYESRSRRPSGLDGARKQKVREHDLSRSKRRSQLDSLGSYLEYPFNNLVATSSKWLHPHVCVSTASRELKDLLELEHLCSLRHINHDDKSGIAKV